MQKDLSSAELEVLTHQCGVSTRLWGRMFSGLTAVTYNDKGHDAVHKLWYEVLTSHQDERYHEGLEKLGIDKDNYQCYPRILEQRKVARKHPESQTRDRIPVHTP